MRCLAPPPCSQLLLARRPACPKTVSAMGKPGHGPPRACSQEKQSKAVLSYWEVLHQAQQVQERELPGSLSCSAAWVHPSRKVLHRGPPDVPAVALTQAKTVCMQCTKASDNQDCLLCLLAGVSRLVAALLSGPLRL